MHTEAWVYKWRKMPNNEDQMDIHKCCCSIAKLCLTLSLHGLQHTRLLCLPQSPRVCSNSCPLSRWCHLTASSSATLFSFHLQSFSVSGSFPMSQRFISGGQSIGASASGSILPMNIQDWFPLGLTGLILLSKGPSRVFFSATIWKCPFLGAQPSLWSNSHICIVRHSSGEAEKERRPQQK